MVPLERYVTCALFLTCSQLFRRRQANLPCHGRLCHTRYVASLYTKLILTTSPAACTTAQCLASVVYGNEQHILTDANKSMLLKSYIPFVAVPLVMLIDTTMRSIRLIEKAIAGETNTKKRQ